MQLGNLSFVKPNLPGKLISYWIKINIIAYAIATLYLWKYSFDFRTRSNLNKNRQLFIVLLNRIYFYLIKVNNMS